MMFFARVFVSRLSRLSSLSLSLSLSLCLFFSVLLRKKNNRASIATLKRHISILLEHGGFHGETTTFCFEDDDHARDDAPFAGIARTSRASVRRAFPKMRPSAAHFFFFGLDSRMRWIRGKKRAVVPSLSLGW